MRIGVIADSHDRLPALSAALERFQAERVDTLLHAGDVIAPFAAKLLAEYPGNVHVVYGNNDGERQGLKLTLPQIADGPLTIELGGRRILMHHFIDWCAASDIDAAEVVITGHTHQIVTERRNDKLLLNPGECCGWVTGSCTAAFLDLDTLTPEVFEIPA